MAEEEKRIEGEQKISAKEARRRNQEAIKKFKRTPLEGPVPSSISAMGDEITKKGHFRGMKARTGQHPETGMVIVDVEGPVRLKKGE